MTTVIGCALGLGVIFGLAWLADRFMPDDPYAKYPFVHHGTSAPRDFDDA